MQPPFDGDTDDELFDNILRKQVHLPRSLGEDSKSIISGVGEAVVYRCTCVLGLHCHVLLCALLQFLTKHPGHRLGCHPQKGQADIRNHAFFRPIDWEKLANREIKPPFKPKSVGLHVHACGVGVCMWGVGGSGGCL